MHFYLVERAKPHSIDVNEICNNMCIYNYVGMLLVIPGSKVITFATSAIFEIIALKTAGEYK